MKKTQIIELLHNIKSTCVSFIAILMFVALGISVFAGMTWISDAMQLSIDQELEQTEFHDVEVSYPYGFTDEEVEEIGKLKGVDEYEAYRFVFQFLKKDGVNYQVKVIQLTKNLDKPMLIEGSLPEKIGEIAVESSFAEKHKLKIGDTVTFDRKELHLTRDVCRITGIMDSPAYLSRAALTYGTAGNSISIDGLIFCTEDTLKVTELGGYTNVLIRNNDQRGVGTYSDEYKNRDVELKNSLEEPVRQISKTRYDSILKKLEKTRKAIKKELKKADKKLKEAEKKISDSTKQLSDAKEKVSKGKEEIKGYEKKLASKKREYNKVNNCRKNIIGMFNKANKYYKAKDYDGLQKYFDKINNNGSLKRNLLTLYSLRNYVSKKTQNKILKLCDDEQAEIQKGNYDVKRAYKLLKTINNTLSATLSKANKAIKKAERKIADGKKKILEYEKEIEKGESLLKLAREKLGIAQTRYDEKAKEAEIALSKLKDPEDYDSNISTREGNFAITSMGVVMDSVEKLRYTMAALFVVVGLLVCYSAVSRIVYDQITRIGTKKAMGLTGREITLSYLAYSGFAVLIGSVIGVLAGIFIVENVLLHSLKLKFVLVGIKPYFNWQLSLLLTLAELVLILACTYFACRTVLKKSAVKLLAGPEPPSGKQHFFENWRIWKRTSLLSKTIVNNFIADKRRVFATLVGVLGCTALVVSAVMLNDNIKESLTRQYDSLYHFNHILNYVEDKEDDIDSREEIRHVLDEQNIKSASVMNTSCILELADNSRLYASIFVSDEDRFNNLIEYYPIGDTKKPKGEGLWLNYSYAKYYGAKAGDQITIIDAKGQSHKVCIDGFFEFYLTRCQMLMSKESYQEVFGIDPNYNAFLLDIDAKQSPDLDKAAGSIPGYVSISDYYTDSSDFFESFTSVSHALVMVYLALAVVMALLVLLNLYTMFVEEKRKELIVLMINGFSVKDARKYISRDTVLLTILGILLGLVLGTIIGYESIGSFENNMCTFILSIDWKACAAGVIVSGILSLIMSRIALRRIDHFSLSDISK